MSETVNRAVVLARRPDGNPVPGDFRVEEQPWTALADGQFRCRNRYVSLDAGFRNWMNEDSGDEVLPAMAIGAPVMGLVLSEVVESRNAEYTEGALLMARFAWEEYSVSDGTDFIARLPDKLEFEASAYMGVLGDTGMSAYFGMIEIGKPQAGDTVLVSGAGGAVGTIAGQIAHMHGARVVGIVGSQKKADWVINELGYDAAVVRGGDTPMADAIAAACSDGVDLFFDNVGGEALEAAIANMNHKGRLVLCGAVAVYGASEPVSGPNNMFDVVTKELKIEGFMTHFRHERYDEARTELAGWLQTGKLKNPEYMLEGIAAVPQAFADMFSGQNFGKTVVKLD